jgi:DNA helicase-2/ATP-dependent DNA helicase PcrA
MNLNTYLAALRSAHGGVLPLNDDQRTAVEHAYDRPLWIIAGPGTGKTHTLVWLTLKRILVDGVDPARIILTTFTRKAATELQSRLIHSRQLLVAAGVREAEAIDLSRITLGTLHSICSRVLQHQHYEPTLHIRVLEDELAQQFFLRRMHNELVHDPDSPVWTYFQFVSEESTHSPSVASRAEWTAKLFNRLTENSADVTAMLASSEPAFAALAKGYQTYQASLTNGHRTDQAHLQSHFLSFLDSSEGRQWLGEGSSSTPGFVVIVDEYQDTNPIQERIYFRLAQRSGDLTVVGDDDQSLYRFRGATVESLIDFDRACEHYLRAGPASVNLRENRRSHPAIVGWVNRFIGEHRMMRDDKVRVRAPRKRALVAAADIAGGYPAVMAIAESTFPKAAQKLVGAIQELKQTGKIVDYSQVALLTFSTRETSRSIGAFTGALRAAGIPLYNPRNGSAHKSELFLQMIGALLAIIDPDGEGEPEYLPQNVPGYIQSARQAYAALIQAPANGALRGYVDSSAAAVRASPFATDGKPNYLTRKGGRRVTVSSLLYKLLSHEPFVSGLAQPEASARLKALNLILAEYEALFYDGELLLDRPEGAPTRILAGALRNFYGVFIEGIHDRLNDPEDDELSVHEGMVNVMTVHQSKGLEFEVVFVLRPDKQPWVSDTHLLEDELAPFSSWPTKPLVRRPRNLRAAEDAVRLYFVAYSRAKRLLIITGRNDIDKWSLVLGHDEAGLLVDSKSALQRLGVHFL